MSCYIRHMKPIYEEATLNPQTKEERKEIDLAIRQIVGKTSEDQCNIVWREVKNWLQDETKKEELITKLGLWKESKNE
jgi:hypothetical protein